MKELLLGIFSGILYGIAGVLTKIALAPVGELSFFSLGSWKIFIFSLPFVEAWLIAQVAIILQLWGFKLGRASVIMTLIAAGATFTSIAGGILIFDEKIPILRILGAAAIVGGVALFKKE